MDNIESSLIRTIATSDLSSVATNIAEIGIDSVLDSGFIKDIPVLSTINGIVKTGGAIKDYLYLKKICRFLIELNNISVNERQSFVDNLGENEEERVKTGENLLLIIDRLDNINKPEILGRMFCDVLLSIINQSEFLALAKSLELIHLGLFPNLKNYYSEVRNNELSSSEALQSLAACGLVGMYFGSGAINSGGGGYQKNKLGELFVKYVA